MNVDELMDKIREFFEEQLGKSPDDKVTENDIVKLSSFVEEDLSEQVAG